MREIKFRGKGIGGEWVYGYLSESKRTAGHPEKGFYISNKAGAPWAFHVRPETIGQYIGLNDQNGKEIYEGDIVKCENMEDRGDGHLDPYIGSVSYDVSQAYFIIASDEPFDGGYGFVDIDICKIIGNIHDNPDLLK